MKDTSIKAYKSEKESGRISKRQQEVIDFLSHPLRINGATARKVSSAVPGGWKRLSELEAMGVVEVNGTIECLVSHKMVSLYKLTGNPPKPITKKPKDDPLKLHDLYDTAHEQGVRDALDYVTKHIYDFGSVEKEYNKHLGKILERSK